MSWIPALLQIRMQLQLRLRQRHSHLSFEQRMAGAQRSAIALAILVVSVPAARASDTWHFQLGAATDRINRGMDLSNNRPSVEAAVSWYPGTGPFAGVSAWTVSPMSGSTGAELLANAGYGWRRGDWGAQAMLLHYQFAHVPGATRLEYDELGLAGSWRESLFASVTASPNTAYAGSPQTLALTYNLVGHLPLARGFSATAGVGYYDLHAGFGSGFFYDDIGLNYQYRSLQFQLAYFGTQAPTRIKAQFGPFLVHRWVAQISWAF